MFQVTYYFNQSDYIISVLYSQAMLEFVYDVWSLFESYLQWPIFICINVNLSFKPRSLHCPGQNRTWDVWLGGAKPQLYDVPLSQVVYFQILMQPVDPI